MLLCHPQSDRPEPFLFFSNTMSDFFVVVIVVDVSLSQIELDAGAFGTGIHHLPTNVVCM